MKGMKPFVVEILAGMALMGISFLMADQYYANMVFSMGFGVMAAAIAQMLRAAYWKNPKRQKAYEAKKQEAYIDRVDERKQYLRMKSGHIAYQIMALLLLVLSFVLALAKVDWWIVGMTFLLFIFQWVVGLVAFRMLEKKM